MPQVYDCETIIIRKEEEEEEEETKFKGISKFVNCIAQIGGRTYFFDDYEVEEPEEENVEDGIWCAVYEYGEGGDFTQTLKCLTKDELAQQESYEYFFVRPLYKLSGMGMIDMRNMPEVAAWNSFNEEYEPDSDGGD